MQILEVLEKSLNMKAKHPDAILLVGVGNSYYAVANDAIAVNEICGLTVKTYGDCELSEIEAVCFASRALDIYLPKIVRAGRRVAISESVETIRTVPRWIDFSKDLRH